MVLLLGSHDRERGMVTIHNLGSVGTDRIYSKLNMDCSGEASSHYSAD